MRDTDTLIQALGDAMRDKNEEAGICAAVALVGGALHDLNRIATALERIADAKV